MDSIVIWQKCSLGSFRFLEEILIKQKKMASGGICFHYMTYSETLKILLQMAQWILFEFGIISLGGPL